MIEDGILSRKEWGENMIRYVISGKIRERGDINVTNTFPPSPHLLFNIILEDMETNSLFNCSGWRPPSGEPFVSIDSLRPGNEK